MDMMTAFMKAKKALKETNGTPEKLFWFVPPSKLEWAREQIGDDPSIEVVATKRIPRSPPHRPQLPKRPI
jgi:hypothetical protein